MLQMTAERAKKVLSGPLILFAVHQRSTTTRITYLAHMCSTRSVCCVSNHVLFGRSSAGSARPCSRPCRELCAVYCGFAVF